MFFSSCVRANSLNRFQSDQDLDMVSDLSGEAGLYSKKLQQEALKRAKAANPGAFKAKGEEEDSEPEITEALKTAKAANPELFKDDEEKNHPAIMLSIYADECDDVELVRKHMDDGALAKLVATYQKKASKLGPDIEFQDPRYQLMLIGACAMTLGCRLPIGFRAYLKKMYKSAGLMRDAVKQMETVLKDGPDGFKDGEPYEFDSPVPREEDRLYPGSMLMNVQAPFGLPPLSGEAIQSIRDKMAESKHGDGACGGCGAKEGKEGTDLLLCSKCKKRSYCSKECQKGHWKLHKKVCKAPEAGKENPKAWSED
jgi:hypothetical protein